MHGASQAQHPITDVLLVTATEVEAKAVLEMFPVLPLLVMITPHDYGTQPPEITCLPTRDMLIWSHRWRGPLTVRASLSAVMIELYTYGRHSR